MSQLILRIINVVLLKDVSTHVSTHTFILCVVALDSAVLIEMIRLETHCKIFINQLMVNYKESKTNTKPA